MNSITFIDTEIDPESRNVFDIGSVKENGSIFHKGSVAEFIQFLKGTQFICGHNIFNHDLRYIGNAVADAGINSAFIIDTLHLSPLLFPTRPYHSLLKDDKLQTEELNNPLNDAIKAKDLFFDEVSAFHQQKGPLKSIFYLLLNNQKEFHAFFRFVEFSSFETNSEKLIRQMFQTEICEYANLTNLISTCPVELAYCLSLINAHNRYSITPPWVLKNYPAVQQIMFLLRSKPCVLVAQLTSCG